MKILITGGAGFIGSNFVYYFLEKHKEWDVVCLDKLTYAANIHTLDQALENPKFKFIKGDIADKDSIFDLFHEEKFDVVINFAGESHVDKSIEDPAVFLTSNMIGTQVLMDASRKFQVKRYHQVPTDEVYGDLPIDRPDLLFTETSVIQASNPYAASKAAADLLAQSYFRTYRFPVTISRCANNYGPYQHLEKLIPAMIIRAQNNEKLPIYGNGANIRDWLHVYDHCTALDQILDRGEIGEVYNIGGNNEKTNLYVVNRILKELGKPDTLIEFVEDRPGHDLRYAIDSTKMKKSLSWEPTIRFEDGIVDTIRWYLDHQNWWKDMIGVLV
ncbi:MAG TPA: dTDP-glucose 4,6-dehydratase [Anaerovoracaceae bacterium]|nr:dTDP-glucose 4,6-dehydratase [Anaerovoracaceae bacterium]